MQTATWSQCRLGKNEKISAPTTETPGANSFKKARGTRESNLEVWSLLRASWRGLGQRERDSPKTRKRKRLGKRKSWKGPQEDRGSHQSRFMSQREACKCIPWMRFRQSARDSKRAKARSPVLGRS